MRRTWWRRAFWLALTGVGLLGGWGLLLCCPAPCFPYRLQEGGLELLSDRPFEAQAARTRLQAVAQRLAQVSAPGRPIRRIFLCHKGWRGRLFFLPQARAVGVSYTPFTANVFVRGGDLAADRLQRPGGEWVAGRFTLSHVMTHELAHAEMGARIGLRFRRLPPWIQEGWAERVAGMEGYTFEGDREAFLRGDPAMNEPIQAPYRRYHLLVAFLLDHQGWTLERLVADAPDQAEVEGWLRSAARGA